jgi:hypothetical protein
VNAKSIAWDRIMVSIVAMDRGGPSSISIQSVFARRFAARAVKPDIVIMA